MDRLFDIFRNKDNGEENQITRYLTFIIEQKKGPSFRKDWVSSFQILLKGSEEEQARYCFKVGVFLYFTVLHNELI